jgi:hypothetical protein
MLPSLYLPIEIIVIIAEFGEWHLSGPLARTSKLFLKTLPDLIYIYILVRLVDTIKNKRNRIPFKWTRFSLPVEWISEEHPLLNNKEISIEVKSLLQLIAPLMFDETNIPFVSGGKVCRILYGKEREEEADIDIIYYNRKRKFLMYRL